jgi:hypothetical protein
MDLITAGSVVTAVSGIVAVMWRLFVVVKTMQSNDLKHLDDKLDGISAAVARAEAKLDRHIEWHAER